MKTELLRLLVADPAVVHGGAIFAACIVLAALAFWLGRITRDDEVAAAQNGEEHAYAELGLFMAEAKKRQPKRGMDGRFKKKPAQRPKA